MSPDFNDFCEQNCAVVPDKQSARIVWDAAIASHIAAKRECSAALTVELSHYADELRFPQSKALILRAINAIEGKLL